MYESADFDYDIRYKEKLRGIENLPKDWQTVMHAKVKPPSIFLKEWRGRNDLPHLVLGDFDLAFQRGKGVWDKDPDTGRRVEYSFISAKEDIWGLGSVVHALAYGVEPAHLDHPQDLVNKRLHEPSLPYSMFLDRCMSCCLDPDPRTRIDALELLRGVESKFNKCQKTLQRPGYRGLGNIASESGDDVYRGEERTRSESVSIEPEEGEVPLEWRTRRQDHRMETGRHKRPERIFREHVRRRSTACERNYGRYYDDQR